MYKHLRDLRESLHLTQEEFGKSVGVAKSTYNNYETGIREPKSDFWISVAQRYGVTIDYLMGFRDDPYSVGPDIKYPPSAAEAAPGKELRQEIIRLAGKLSPEHQDLFLAILRLIAARNQGLSAADLVSVGEAALKSGSQNPTR